MSLGLTGVNALSAGISTTAFIGNSNLGNGVFAASDLGSLALSLTAGKLSGAYKTAAFAIDGALNLAQGGYLEYQAYNDFRAGNVGSGVFNAAFGVLGLGASALRGAQLGQLTRVDAPKNVANVSELRGRQLASEFTGNKIKRYRRQMQSQGGYGDFPPIKVAIVDGRKIIIDGHHRARAAGAAGIRDIPFETIELPPDIARKYFHQAAEAAERFGLPF